MPNVLPARANLEQLKKQAKELLRALRAADPLVFQRAREHHPGWSDLPDSRLQAATLTDAQWILAREYGFESWTRLKEAVQRRGAEEPVDPHLLFKQAFEDDDAEAFGKLLEEHPQFKARINDPVLPFDSPVIINARSRAMLDVLLAAGADINARSQWWAGGFGVLHGANPEVAAYAIERGARVDAHAAARLGLLPELRRLVGANPGLVHERGGDGQTPLHFAKTVEIAEYLLQQGADIDARDIDHESTPAQWMVRERPEVARFLVERGCRTDLLMVTALGDLVRVRQHLDQDPACIRMNVSPRFFPMQNPKAGGSIYIWTLGRNKSAHSIAREFGHREILELLLQRSPEDLKAAVAFELGDQPLIAQLLARNPGLIQKLSSEDARRLADAAQDNNIAAVKSMLEAGWPAGARGQHGATALHWAAFHGNAVLAATILRHQPPLEWTDHDFQGTPVGWAIHGSEHGWYCRTGDYAGTLEVLLNAGARPPEKITRGSEPVKAVLRRRGIPE